MISKLIVNAITLSRIVLSTVFAYVVITSGNHIVLLSGIFALICISDLLDGILARNLHATSRVGAYLDVLADLFFMMSASISLIITGIYPAWMLMIIIVKFLEFWFTSSFIRKLGGKSSHVFMFDWLGRRVVVAFYILPFIIILAAYYLTINVSFLIINVICFSLAIGALVSSLQRIMVCLKNKSTVINT